MKSLYFHAFAGLTRSLGWMRAILSRSVDGFVADGTYEGKFVNSKLKLSNAAGNQGSGHYRVIFGSSTVAGLIEL